MGCGPKTTLESQTVSETRGHFVCVCAWVYMRVQARVPVCMPVVLDPYVCMCIPVCVHRHVRVQACAYVYACVDVRCVCVCMPGSVCTLVPVQVCIVQTAATRRHAGPAFGSQVVAAVGSF